MKKLFIGLLSVFCLLTLSVSLSACAKNKTEADRLADEGYVISVKYDACGGQFFALDNTYLLDMFKPENYQADEEGKIKLKLLDPVDARRDVDNLKLERNGYFNVGWYRTRELVKDALGNVLDENGNVVYYDEITEECFVDEKRKKTVVPAYTFSDPWDFENDLLVYNNDGKKFSMTLYAAWLPQFTFSYYAKNEDGEWEQYAKTSFDYSEKTAATDDYNVCYLPRWSDLIDGNECGGITYKYRRANGKDFRFESKADDLQFLGAYTDPEMTNKIDGSIKHIGSVNSENATANNPDMKIYVDYEKGAKYRIYTAQQLIDNADADGIFEIYRDLDFLVDSVDKNNESTKINLKWSSVFESSTFTGSIIGKTSNDGGVATLKNIYIEHSADNRTQGGLFGSIGDGAKIENIVLSNVTFDLQNTGKPGVERNFGLLAGYIGKSATLNNLTLTDARYRISGDLDISNGQNLYLIANNESGCNIVRTGDYVVEVYGALQSTKNYRYTFEYQGVDEKGKIIIHRLKKALFLDDKAIEYHPYTEE